MNLKYLIKWKGYDDLTWEMESHMQHAQEIINDYHSKNEQDQKRQSQQWSKSHSKISLRRW